MGMVQKTGKDKLRIEPLEKPTKEDLRQMFILHCKQYNQMGEQLKVLAGMLHLLLWEEKSQPAPKLVDETGEIHGD